MAQISQTWQEKGLFPPKKKVCFMKHNYMRIVVVSVHNIDILKLL